MIFYIPLLFAREGHLELYVRVKMLNVTFGEIKACSFKIVMIDINYVKNQKRLFRTIEGCC